MKPTEKQKEYHHEYYQKNKRAKWPWLFDKKIAKNRKLKFHYGITLEQYDVLLQSQNGKCAICEKTEERPLSVDHDHETNKVRGLLCLKCNSALGFVNENTDTLDSMKRYISKHKRI